MKFNMEITCTKKKNNDKMDKKKVKMGFFLFLMVYQRFTLHTVTKKLFLSVEDTSNKDSIHELHFMVYRVFSATFNTTCFRFYKL